MRVERGGHIFDVVDLDDAWGFWSRFSSGQWESEILDRIPGLLADGGTFVDIGAWVGPHTLWASRFADDVIAVEPDPTAFSMLTANIEANCDNVKPVHAAVADHNGMTTIGTNGDSESRTGGDGVPVICHLLADLIPHSTSLVKIDIEGAEDRVVPAAAEHLAAVGAPMFLSVHRWSDTSRTFRALSGWHLEQLTEWEYLCRP